MTDQTKPMSGQGTTPAPVSDATTLAQLVELLLAERRDALEDRKAKAEALEARNRQRQINSEYNIKDKLQAQTLCTHKKGGKHGPKSPKIDYAVYYHTFTDATSYIRCQICGMKWRNLDTAEYLLRGGKKVPNHTGISWQEAYQMLQESTNTPSSSEVLVSAKPIESDVAHLE